MEKKTFRAPMQFKEDSQGEFAARFATLNVKDRDGDVTMPGAFTDGEGVRISSWGHKWDELPVGRGAIREQGSDAIVEGKFFLDTEVGKQHYLTVKNMGDLQEWSYGFDILEAEPGMFNGEQVRFLKRLKVFEVSPVMLGAGVNTQTMAIKTGARHSAKDNELVQQIHDAAVKLGAKCAAPDGESDSDAEGDGQGADGKSATRSRPPSTVAERAAIELLEVEYT